jgi:hypothetical protein
MAEFAEDLAEAEERASRLAITLPFCPGEEPDHSQRSAAFLAGGELPEARSAW